MEYLPEELWSSISACKRRHSGFMMLYVKGRETANFQELQVQVKAYIEWSEMSE
jgi:hypothetical protein